MSTFSGPLTANAQSTEARDCRELRVQNDWSREEYRACRRGEIQQNIDQLDAQFAQMKSWLQARGLDVNDAGHITDPQGRTLAQIETSNAALAEGNADLVDGNTALRAEIRSYRLRSKIADERYQSILREFEATILQSQ